MHQLPTYVVKSKPWILQNKPSRELYWLQASRTTLLLHQNFKDDSRVVKAVIVVWCYLIQLNKKKIVHSNLEGKYNSPHSTTQTDRAKTFFLTLLLITSLKSKKGDTTAVVIFQSRINKTRREESDTLNRNKLGSGCAAL